MNPKAAEELGLLPYDSADYLRDDEDIAAYLQAVIGQDSEDSVLRALAMHVVACARVRHQLIGLL